ncbi:hypothetical protein JCM8547_009117 [Rhodosporidiobolus lusitaniae]
MSNLLGTPVRPRDQRSTGAPSPYTPNPFRTSSSHNPPNNPLGPRTGSPLKQPSQLPPPSSPSATSDTQSQTLDNPSSSSSTHDRSSQPPSQLPSSRQQPSEAELKAQARAAVLKTRIVADASLSSAFRKEDDPELFALFVG